MAAGRDRTWGIGIAILFAAFVVFNLACVLVAAFQKYDLVADDYYQKELTYQGQIDRIERTRALPEQPRIEYHAGEQAVILSFPAMIPPEDISGRVTLFRPSGSRWDQLAQLNIDAGGTQVISMQSLPKGNWRVKLDWQVADTEYYSEELLYLE